MYENKEFGKIRTMVMPDGQIGFVGKDVARVLGYKDEQKAIKMHVDDEDKLTRQIVVSGQRRNVTFINESGLYAPYLKRGLEAYRTRKGTNLFGEVAWTDSYLVWTEKGREFVNRLMMKQVA